MEELRKRVDSAGENFTSGAYIYETNEKSASHDAGYARACKDILNMEIEDVE